MTQGRTTSTRRDTAGRSPGQGPPVSYRRYALGVFLLATLIALSAAYRHFTDPERIRASAERYLETLIDARVRVGAAGFDLFEGIRLTDVRAYARPESVAGGVEPALQDQPELVFSADGVQLTPRTADFLFGRFAISRVTATSPTFVVEWDDRKGRYNWQQLLSGRGSGGTIATLPDVRLREVRLRLRGGTAADPQIEDVLTLDVVASPKGDDPQRIEIVYRSRTTPGERGTVEFYRPTGAVRLTQGVLPSLSIHQVMIAAPMPDRKQFEWIDLLELRGQLGADRLVVDPKEPQRLRATLRDGSLSIPIDEVERIRPAKDRYFNFQSVDGLLVYDEENAEAEFDALLGDSRCHVRATARRVADRLESLDDVELSAQIRCENYRLPRTGPEASIGEEHVTYKWKKIRDFYEDFSPRGRVRIEADLVKPAGQSFQLRRLVMEAVDASAEFHGFPYRIDQLTGTVAFTPDGVVLNNLTGFHGTARIVVAGKLDSTAFDSGLDLDIRATNVPLDTRLHHALPDRYKRIWSQFAPTGMAHVNVRMHRDAPQPGTKPSWQSEIHAALIDAEAAFVGFPYRVNHLSGQLVFADERLQFRRVHGYHGDMSVMLDGSAVYREGADTSLELRVQAENVALDQDLVQALPPTGRDALAQFAPEGRADLIGRVFTPAAGGGVAYDLVAGVRNATFRYRNLPLRLDNVSGSLRFRPDSVEVLDLHGEKGNTEIGISGRFAIPGQSGSSDVTVRCRGLELDEELFAVLPAGLQAVRERFAPRGAIDLDLRMVLPSVQTGEVNRYTASIRALGNQVTYHAFPLPLEEVRGTLEVSEKQVRFDNLTARVGDARLVLGGQYDLSGPLPRGTFAIKTSNMAFDDTLKQALPWRLRRLWNDVNPRGTFDLDLREFSYESTDDGRSRYTFDGLWTLHDAALDLGFDANALSGTVAAKGSASSQGEGFAVEADVALAGAGIGPRRLTDVTGHLSKKPNSDLLRVQNVRAAAYGGRLEADGEVTFGHESTAHKISLILRDMDFGALLNDSRGKEEKPVAVKGKVNGKIFLTGRSDDPKARRGGGEVWIYDAQVFKLPLFLSILHIANLTPPDDNAFHTLRSSFYLTGEDLQFQTLDLRGTAIAMIGKGRMNLPRREVDVQLFSVSPHDLPRVPLITEFMEGASRELMEILVTGPIGDPKLSARSLRTVDGTVRSLFGQRSPGD